MLLVLFLIGLLFAVAGLALIVLARRIQQLMLSSVSWSAVALWPSLRPMAEATIRSASYRWLIRTVGFFWLLFGLFAWFSLFHQS